MTLGPQPGQQLRQDPRLERRRLRLVAAMDQLVLLGDVRQVEELVERPRHRQQFILAQLVEAGTQLGVHGATPVSLGTLANLLDLVEKPIPVLLADGVAQQLTQEVNIFAQACIDIGHQRFSSEWQSAIRRSPEAQECRSQPVLTSRRRIDFKPSRLRLVS